MKKLVAMLLAGVLAFSMVGCGSSDSSSSSSDSSSSDTASDTTEETEETSEEETETAEETSSGMTYEEWMEQEPALVGVCFAQINDEYNGYKTFLQDYIGPQYNLEFIFSEAVEDISDEISFLESCAAQGAVAFINFASNDVIQMADRCEELGIYLMMQTVLSDDELEILSYDYVLGTSYADTAVIGELYAEGLETIMEGEELNGIILTTAMASKGNVQHTDTGVNILNSVATLKDLTYTDDVESIVTSTAAIVVENSADLPIYIYPGTVSNVDGYLAGLSSQLMTGDYNVVVSSTTGYSQMMTVITEAEEALGSDIKLISVAAVGADLETAMTNEDVYGNLTLDAAVIKPGTWVIGGLVVPILNALTGYTDAYKYEDGTSARLSCGSFLVTTTEEMQAINTKDDVDVEGSWVMQYENIDAMLGMMNADITVDDVVDYMGQDLNDLFG